MIAIFAHYYNHVIVPALDWEPESEEEILVPLVTKTFSINGHREKKSMLTLLIVASLLTKF